MGLLHNQIRSSSKQASKSPVAQAIIRSCKTIVVAWVVWFSVKSVEMISSFSEPSANARRASVEPFPQPPRHTPAIDGDWSRMMHRHNQSRHNSINFTRHSLLSPPLSIPRSPDQSVVMLSYCKRVVLPKAWTDQFVFGFFPARSACSVFNQQWQSAIPSFSFQVKFLLATLPGVWRATSTNSGRQERGQIGLIITLDVSTGGSKTIMITPTTMVASF